MFTPLNRTTMNEIRQELQSLMLVYGYRGKERLVFLEHRKPKLKLLIERVLENPTVPKN